MKQSVAARPPLVGPRPWFQSGKFLLFLAVLLVVYAYGWQVTKIDLPELVTGAKFVRPFLRDLLRPELLTRARQTQQVEVAMSIDPAVPPEELPPASGPTLEVPTHVAPIGSRLAVSGRGFQPNAEGTLYWLNPIGNPQQVARIRTDAQGRFRTTIVVPEAFRGPEAGPRGAQQRLRAVVEWPVGPLRPSNTLLIVGQKIIETVFLALMGTTIAVIAAVPLSFLGARNLMAKNPLGTAVYYLTRTFFNIMRSIEPLILAIVFTVWVGLGPFAGVLALGLHSIAALGKLYSEQIESIDPGPIEAITATGASALQIVRYAVVPQIVPPFIAFTIYRWDTNVRMSTVIGFVGGGGIGFVLQQYINLLQYRQAATAVWAITLVVAAMDYVSAVVREKVV
ncbi:MAG TPA: phosphonate ABC transporter, permease protein PhnE [bacterium]|nr:phosphonate ABC transporter, permease protein PhnE [bacterium]